MTSSLQSSTNPTPAPVQKQRLNVYTVMLLIAIVAIGISCWLLYMELQKYGEYPWWDTKSLQSPPATSWLPSLPQPIARFIPGLPISIG